MKIVEENYNYSYLSVKDLLEAREMFHVHLMRKANVIATAIGRYRIRVDEPWPQEKNFKEYRLAGKETPKTLGTTEVRDYSWPCILVFVSDWMAVKDIKAGNYVPPAIYMPDGRVVPVCVIQAEKEERSDDMVDPNRLQFPRNVISGGFPVIVVSQGVDHIASLACLVTDGNKVYALTNKHVVGEEGTPIHTRLRGRLIRIGVSSRKQIGKVKFSEVYTGWAGTEQFINSDIGLIDIDDQNLWKTEVFGIGQIGHMVDLNIHNISLNIINVKDNALVSAFGAVSGKLEGEIVALFYRYKSIGGVEYNADYLIGPRKGGELNIHHGDSGTLWLLENKEEGKLPIAIQWGQHELMTGAKKEKQKYALATCLSHVCRTLEVEIIRTWNLDQDYTWGKTGHFKIAAKACELVSDSKLSTLLMANQENIGVKDASLIAGDSVGRVRSGEFVPLADVADLLWRMTRKMDASNHYADADEKKSEIFGGKSLLELCEDETKIDIDIWNDFYDQFGKPKDKRGALPFRVWQIYDQMVKSLQAGNIVEFVCAGGIVSHYVADACISLHISYLHHGRPDANEFKVHSDYENGMIDRNMEKLFSGVNVSVAKVNTGELIKGGKASAKLVTDLMRRTLTTLPPMDIIDIFSESSGRGKYDRMWIALGERTIKNIADGCHAMAVLWECAWEEGNGKAISQDRLVEIDRSELESLYSNKDFLPAYRLSDPEFKAALADG